MVHAVIRIDTKDGESRTREIGPCDLVVFMGASQMEQGIKTQAGAIGGNGMGVGEMVFSLANSTADVLLEVCGDSRDMQASILKAYMDSFLCAAIEKAGTSVMDKVAKLIEKDC